MFSSATWENHNQGTHKPCFGEKCTKKVSQCATRPQPACPSPRCSPLRHIHLRWHTLPKITPENDMTYALELSSAITGLEYPGNQGKPSFACKGNFEFHATSLSPSARPAPRRACGVFGAENDAARGDEGRCFCDIPSGSAGPALCLRSL